MSLSRIQLTQDIYMPLNGQWQIVLSGSVIDIPATLNIAPSHATILAETPAAVTKPTSVRSVRTK